MLEREMTNIYRHYVELLTSSFRTNFHNAGQYHCTDMMFTLTVPYTANMYSACIIYKQYNHTQL